MAEKITEWTISIDRGKLEEEIQLEAGIIISRKSHTNDLFNIFINCVNSSIPSHLYLIRKEEMLVSQRFPKNSLFGKLKEGELVSKEIFGHDPEEPLVPFPPPMKNWNEGLEDRKCFNSKCQKKIGYGEFRMRNALKLSKEALENIWNSPYVQLYCCSCFRKKRRDKESFNKLAKKRERLLNKAYKINEKFGFLVD